MTDAPDPPPAVSLSDLPAAEAREIFDRFVAGEPARLATFLAEVRRRDGPAERLDHSLESLETVWSWFLAEHRPRRWFARPHRMPSSPVSDATMRNAHPPWWYDHHPQFGQKLGPYLAQDREVVLVRAPGLSAAELESMAAGIWKRRAGGSHVRQA